MGQRTFMIRAVWDGDAGVFYSESDIIGLHIEAKTLDEFEEIFRELAPDLIVANHMSAEEMASKPLRDLVPAIVWRRPEPA